MFVAGFTKQVRYYMRLADFFITCLAKGEKAPVDSGAADGVIGSLPTAQRLSAYYFVGRFLELRGQPEHARQRRSVQPHHTDGECQPSSERMAGFRHHADRQRGDRGTEWDNHHQSTAD